MLHFSKRTRNSLVLAAASALTISASAGVTHKVDGDFSDWAGIAPIATDPSGDASDNFDLTTLSVDNEGSVLFLLFDTSVVANLPAGSSSDGDLIITVGLPGGETLTLNMRSRFASHSGSGGLSWTEIDFASAPTFAADVIEMRFDLAQFGVSQGDSITVSFSGSDSFNSGPANYTMTGAPVTPVRRSADRFPATSFRVASVNTLFGGLIGGSSESAFRRMIDGIDAEVYCFQEEGNNSAASIEALIESVDPLEDGADWSVYKNSGTVIAARGTIIPLTEFSSRYAAAIVEPIAGEPVIIMSVHLKCCGFINSSEDFDRIDQAQDMAQTIAVVRNSPPNAPLEPYKNAPVVAVGDYNHVGSNEPVVVLEGSPAPELVRWLLPHLIGESITTWRNSGSSFWPGTLDLIMHSPDLVRRNGFVFDTAELNASEAAALGVNTGDSLTASDHLMLVTDFGFSPAGDINGDCVVDTADLGLLISVFGSTSSDLADLNNDGVVDTADLGILIAAFGSACG